MLSRKSSALTTIRRLRHVYDGAAVDGVLPDMGRATRVLMSCHRSFTGLGTLTRQHNATRPHWLRLSANVGHLDFLLSCHRKLVGLRTAQLRIAIRALSPNMGHDRRQLFV